MRTIGLDLILQALDISLDRRKIALAIVGLFATVVVTGLLLYIAARVEAELLSTLLRLLGLLVGWILLTLVYGTVAKMSYDELSGRQEQGWGTAMSYSLSHMITLLFAPLVLLLGIALIAWVEVLILFLGRIPYVGELWASLLFLPLIVLNLFLTLLGYLGVWLIPAVVAGEDSGVIETLNHVQKVIRLAPGRILAYLSISVILGLLAALVIFPLVYSATANTMLLTTAALGSEEMSKFAVALPDLLISSLMPGRLGDLGELLYQYGIGDVPVTYRLGGMIFLAILILIPTAILVTLFIVFPVSCACATYISVRTEKPEASAVTSKSSANLPGRFCIRCGQQISASDRFCMHCGSLQGAES